MRLFYCIIFIFSLCPAWSRDDTSLLVYWDFDKIDKGQVEDRSGHGRHGQVQGTPEVVAGIRGKGLRFKSNEDYVDFGRAVIPAWDFTVSVWIKCDDVKKQFFLGQYLYQHSQRLDLVIREGRVLIQIGDKLSSDKMITKDRWYHLVYARKGAVMRIYVDGVMVKEGKLATAVMQDAPLMVGKIIVPNRDSFQFTGVMDELKIYDRALTAEEVKLLYAVR